MSTGRFFITPHIGRIMDNSTDLTKPKEVGHFSIDCQRKFTPDDSQKRYLRIPQFLSGRRLYVDLNVGYENAVHRAVDEPRPFEYMLRWVLVNKHLLKKRPYSSEEGGSFVFNRGSLCTIATSTHRKTEWMVCATRFQGVIYMCLVDTERQKSIQKHWTGKDARQFYWRHRFRHILTSSKTSKKTGGFVEVNENESFYVVLRSRLNQHRLLYSAAVGAEDLSHSGTSTSRYVHIASYGLQARYKELRNVRWEYLLVLWCQTFFTGISNVVCGLHDDKGTLNKIVKCKTSTLPAVTQNFWIPDEVVNFCDEFLTFVNEVVVEDDPRVVYCFSRGFSSETVECEQMSACPRFTVLPEWFIAEFEKQ